MASRLELQTLLEAISGVSAVYFQPPSNVEMQYPCIVYSIDSADTKFADNASYSHTWRYQLTVIDRNPDSEIPSAIVRLPLARFGRRFMANNFNHDVFEIFF
jgi:hypothetical protein